jgi:glycine/serine hydroxymethyltransferase
MKADEISEVARLIATALKDDSEAVKSDVRKRVTQLTTRFRPYPDVQ